ncbi:MAG: hypothetical protein OXI57_11715 [Rhodospirillales bacterium]|nr:hypothetical protein [Rhodospirillales bacterium]
MPFSITGGIPPYHASIEGCPDWVTLFSDQGILAGTAPARDVGETFFCSYQVTDSTDPDPQSTSRILRLVVGSADDGTTVTPLRLSAPAARGFIVNTFYSVTLPAASGGVGPYTYALTCAGGKLPRGMGFIPETRVLAGTPNEGFRDSCAYTVFDSSRPAEQVSKSIQLAVFTRLPPPLTVPTLPDQELSVGIFRTIVFPAATGGLKPYEYALTCAGRRLPPGMGFASETRVLAGTPNRAFRDSCVYTVTDGSIPAAKVSRPVQVTVLALDLGTWRFRTRTLERSNHAVTDAIDTLQTFVTLPHALPEAGEVRGTERYELLDIQSPLEFEPSTRALSYRHTGVQPIFGTPTTFRYQVYSANDVVQDALCVDVSFHDVLPKQPRPDGVVDTAAVWVRDDAYWDAAKGEYRCPDAARPQASSSGPTVSNPVHTALAPLHARRAVATAHAAVRDRVRDWSPGAPLGFAVSPTVEFASLSGESGGFDYTGSGESLTGSVELGAGSWQAGLIASFTRTDLDYRAAASLAGRGYRAGEHDTEILSVHPFAAWHAGFGGKLWASLGAGTGDLRHRDDLGFPSRSRSDVRLSFYGLGASVPVAEVLSGELDAEAGIDGFAFEIEGGGQISTSLPTLRGRDYRAGLAWSAPVPGTPNVSVAYRQLTGDGPEGAQVEARGSASVEGFLDPRLTLKGKAEATFGLGDYGHDSWQLGGGLHFASDGSARGLELDLDARVMSPTDGSEAGVGLRGEAGYGLPGESPFGIVRPFVGLTRYPRDGSQRRAVGLDLLDTPTSQLSLEFYDYSRDRSRAVELTLHHRF